MRDVIARCDIQPILTEGRSQIEIDASEIIQEILDEYQSGIQITQVQTQKADPPDHVIDAFRDVQAARADMERSKNEAEAYANDVIPRARGEAEKILQAAEAYKKEVVAKASTISLFWSDAITSSGGASRFKILLSRNTTFCINGSLKFKPGFTIILFGSPNCKTIA